MGSVRNLPVRGKTWSSIALLLASILPGCTTLGAPDVAETDDRTRPGQTTIDRVNGLQYASLVRDNEDGRPAIAGIFEPASSVPRGALGANRTTDQAQAGPNDQTRAGPNGGADAQLAQFAVPQAPAGGGETPTAPPSIPGQLKFEYVLGTEAEVEYLNNIDLDSSLSDNSLIGAPTIFGSVVYRPTDWLETRGELTFEKLIDIRVNDFTELPNGGIQKRERQKASLLVDQAFAKVSPQGVPAELTVGRRNFEDQRLWLYDTALDGAIVTLKPGDFNIEASLTRENLVDLDFLTSSPTGQINNYIVYGEYRGIEDNRLAAYWILLDDRDERDGKPQFYGLRAIGRPSDPFNYWADLGFTGGRDENKQSLDGWGFDVGGTYRFLETPLQPSVTLAYRFGSGDRNPNDNENDEFRQTGFQSNEGRFGGVTQFVTYGETLNPELSNIRIITAGASIRPLPGMFVDVVFHNYRFDEIAQDVRGSNLTALANQIAGQESKDIGNELDIIVGFRDLLGLRGLGFEVRGGVFFPGDAFDRDNGSGGIEDADLGFSALVVSFF